MASLPQTNGNQNPPPYPQAAAAAPPDIQSRSIATPERRESRRVGLNGRVGSQKASRIICNEAHCRCCDLPFDILGLRLDAVFLISIALGLQWSGSEWGEELQLPLEDRVGNFDCRSSEEAKPSALLFFSLTALAQTYCLRSQPRIRS